MYPIPETEAAEISTLARQKFATPEWQYGYSPAYTFNSHHHPDGLELEIFLSVEKGKILSAQISGNYYEPEKAALLELELSGKSHLFDEVKEAHATLGIEANDGLIYCYF
jgi:lipoate-protein ligase A